MTPIKNFLRKFKFANRIRQKIFIYRVFQYITYINIRKKRSANVVLFAVNRPMWRYHRLYKLLVKDSRFNVMVVVSSFDTYSEEETEKYKAEITNFFIKENVKYILQENLPQDTVIKSLKPDILFYPQPYELFGKNASYVHFKNKLLVYIPYAMNSGCYDWLYNTNYQNVAWRVYYPTAIHRETSKKLSIINGKNVVVAGEPNADEYFDNHHRNVWKNNDAKKRVIYAPHFQIFPNETFYRPSFLWTGEFMLNLASRYSDQIQIAFKPHPRLYSELCKHPDWGEAKANDYYNKWEMMANTQLINGDFIDLFATSDALIHDCGSFTAEYQFTKKPCMFLTRDEKSITNFLCPFGIKCYENHYIGSSCEDIVDFIEKVVLEGDDPKLEQREQFYNDYLLLSKGNSTAENIYNDLVKSLFGK